MSITLYHCHEARSMRSLWLLNELKSEINLEFKLVILPFEGLRTKDYLSIHPLGRIPALIDDDLQIMESGAICQYLCERYSPDNLGRSSASESRVQWLQWLHFAETIAVHGASMTQQLIVLQDETLRSPIVQKLEKRRLEKSIGVVEKRLQNQDYLADSKFSAADIAVGYSLHLAQYYTKLDVFPRVHDYYKRLKERPEFQASMPEKGAENLIFTKAFYC